MKPIVWSAKAWKIADSSRGRGLIVSRPSVSAIGDVPVGDRVLAAEAVRDVGVVADRVPRRHGLPQLGQAHPHLRPEDDAAQPRRLGLQEREELVEPLGREALRRDPHLGLRGGTGGGSPPASPAAPCRYFGCVWPGSPPGTKTASIRGSLRKTSPHSSSADATVFGVGVIRVHRRIPDPDVQAVIVGRSSTCRSSSRSAGGGSAGCRRRRPTGAGSARWRWCRRGPGRGCSAPTAAGPRRRTSWSWADSRADGRGADTRGAEASSIRSGSATLPGFIRSVAQQPADAEEDAAGIAAGDQHRRGTAAAVAVDGAERSSRRGRRRPRAAAGRAAGPGWSPPGAAAPARPR